MGGRITVESVVRCLWNGWPDDRGIRKVAGDGHEGHLGAAYFNEWHDLVAQADVWIFGHTHHAVDTIVSGCRLISNPRGYPGERTGFSPDFTIEV